MPLALTAKRWRLSSRIVIPTAAAAVLAAIIVSAVTAYAVRQADALAIERQRNLIESAVGDVLKSVAHDQQSVTVWDDAVRNTVVAFDPTWVDVNLGVWMHSFFAHDRVFVLNADNMPIYAMNAGKAVDVDLYDESILQVGLLAREMRLRLYRMRQGNQQTTVSDLVAIARRPAVVSISPLISDTGAIPQVSEREFLHVTVRFLDAGFLERLAHNFAISAPYFSWTPVHESDRTSVPLRSLNGSSVGYVAWDPVRPGAELLRRIAPALGLAGLLFVAVIMFLLRRIRRAAMELETSEVQAQHLAFHDPLTGLANRALFNDALERAVARSRQDGSPLTLLYLDLDRFKEVNDTLGHVAGDDLIRALAERLGGIMRPSDLFARIGGDEFAIIRPGESSDTELATFCDRIIKTVGQPFQLLGNSAFVGVSIGISFADESSLERSELIRRADIALYQAKAGGGNRFRVFAPEMDASARQRRDIERDLRAAIQKGGQFEVVYQPLYASGDLKVAGIEALLRWHHPEHKLISPGVFIPIAEESGLINPIGEFVLRQACRDAARWPVHHIAVNVSPVQLRNTGFVATVTRILAETGLEPHRLELEITETVLLEATDRAGQTLKALRALGIRLALDDFGTGYSSLSYLQKYKVDRIKVDRSFVNNIDSASPSNAIVHAMVDLARAVGIAVTAEGVETEVQRDFLKRAGCDELQGFLLSHPLPREEIDGIFGAQAVSQQSVASAA